MTKKEHCLIVTELPYGVYTNTVCGELEKLSQKDDNFGIVRINDLTGEQVCMKLYLAKAADPKQMIDYLYQNTSLQSSYSINLTMLEDGRFPKVFKWKDALLSHLRHEEEVYTRCYEHEKEELHHKIKILNALRLAARNIDVVVEYVQAAESFQEASSSLQKALQIDEEQAKAILDMKLSRLSKLEIDDIEQKLNKNMDRLAEVKDILSNKDRLYAVMIERFQEVSKKFGDNRRTQVIQKEIVAASKVKKEKTAEPVVICYTDNGYIKSIPAAKYRKIDGNLGCIETTTDRYIQIYNTHKVYRLKVEKIKQCLASEKGTALGTILGTGLTHIRMIAANGEDKDVIAISKSGRIKKFNTSLFNGTTQNIKGQDYFPKNDVLFVFEPTEKYLYIESVNGYKLCCDISDV